MAELTRRQIEAVFVVEDDKYTDCYLVDKDDWIAVRDQALRAAEAGEPVAERYRHIRACYFSNRKAMAYDLGWHKDESEASRYARYDTAIDESRAAPAAPNERAVPQAEPDKAVDEAPAA